LSVSTAIGDAHEKFKTMLTHRYFIRVHMAIMLSLVVVAGVMASRALLSLGVRPMVFRYPLAVVSSYLIFFLLIRLWLSYVARVAAARRSGSESSCDPGSVIPDGTFHFSGGSAKGASGLLKGGGGGFGGGGSSGSFEEGGVADMRPSMAVAVAAQPQASAAPSHGGSSSSSSFGLDIDGDGLILLVLFALLVVAILGVGAYVVYQAPAILSEAAFQAILVPGLVKTSKNAHDSCWEESVLKATLIPLAIVLVLAILFGYEANRRCPGAATVRQVMRTCVFR
jgi:hypothetical protein